jgi:hypothetical protein
MGAWCFDSIRNESLYCGSRRVVSVALNRNANDSLRSNIRSRVQVHEELGGAHLSALGLCGFFEIWLDTLLDERKDMLVACVRERETFALRAGDNDFVVPVEDCYHAGESFLAGSDLVTINRWLNAFEHVHVAVDGNLYELPICERGVDPPVGHEDDAVPGLCADLWRASKIRLRTSVEEIYVELYANFEVSWLYAFLNSDGLCSIVAPQQDLEEGEREKLIEEMHVCQNKKNRNEWKVYSRRLIPKE